MRLNYREVRAFLEKERVERITRIAGAVDGTAVSAAGGGRPWHELCGVTQRCLSRLMFLFVLSHPDYKFVRGDEPCIMANI